MGAVKSFYRKKMEQVRLNHLEFDMHVWKKESEAKAKKIKNHFKKKGLK